MPTKTIWYLFHSHPILPYILKVFIKSLITIYNLWTAQKTLCWSPSLSVTLVYQLHSSPYYGVHWWMHQCLPSLAQKLSTHHYSSFKSTFFLLFILPKKPRNSACIAGTMNTSDSQRCFRSCSALCSALQGEDKTTTSYTEGSHNREEWETRKHCRKKPWTPKTVKEAKAPEDHMEEKRQWRQQLENSNLIWIFFSYVLLGKFSGKNISNGYTSTVNELLWHFSQCVSEFFTKAEIHNLMKRLQLNRVIRRSSD